MLKEKKRQLIDKLTGDLSQNEVVIATDYRGLNTKQMSELRQSLAKAGGEYHVVKNTLACIAANKAGKKNMVDMIDGPVALALSHSDAVNLAKALNQYIKSTESPLKITGGLLGERLLTPEEVINLASLPSKEVLVSQLIAWLQAPITGLPGVLNSPLQGLIAVLQSRKEQSSEQ